MLLEDREAPVTPVHPSLGTLGIDHPHELRPGPKPIGDLSEHLSRPLQIGFGVVGGAVIVASLLVIRGQAKRLEAAAEAALPGPLERFDA